MEGPTVNFSSSIVNHPAWRHFHGLPYSLTQTPLSTPLPRSTVLCLFHIKCFFIVFSNYIHRISLFRLSLFSFLSYNPTFYIKIKRKASKGQFRRLHLPQLEKFKTSGSKQIYDNVCEKIKVAPRVLCSNLKKS